MNENYDALNPATCFLLVPSEAEGPPVPSLCVDLGAAVVLPITGVFLVDGCRNRMTSQTKRMDITLESMMDSVDLAEDIILRIAEASGFDDEERHRIGMAVREGVINAVTYGNHQNREKKVFLTIELDNGRLVIRILDQGDGYVLADVPDPLAEENLLKSSGRGILLMKAFMDEFDVVRGRTGGAEVTLVKKLPAAS
jgi:serine/threonine-protein kinase RsbW